MSSKIVDEPPETGRCMTCDQPVFFDEDKLPLPHDKPCGQLCLGCCSPDWRRLMELGYQPPDAPEDYATRFCFHLPHQFCDEKAGKSRCPKQLPLPDWIVECVEQRERDDDMSY